MDTLQLNHSALNAALIITVADWPVVHRTCAQTCHADDGRAGSFDCVAVSDQHAQI